MVFVCKKLEIPCEQNKNSLDKNTHMYLPQYCLRPIFIDPFPLLHALFSSYPIPALYMVTPYAFIHRLKRRPHNVAQSLPLSLYALRAYVVKSLGYPRSHALSLQGKITES